jgi:hypothetical protein
MLTDKEQIKELILNSYHKGHEISDGELYRPILHDKWRIFWISQEKRINHTDKETYISWYKPEKIDKKLIWETKILNIDIEGNLAMAKIKIFNQEFGYLDYFQFMKEENKWVMINKISERLKEK